MRGLDTIRNIILGILLCLAIAILSWTLGKTIPIIGGPVFSIVIGILIALLFPALTARKFGTGWGFEAGIKFTSKRVLQLAIVLLGFQMNFYIVLSVGRQSLLVMVFTFASAFLVAVFIGKALNLPGNSKTLIGVGTAVCGASAIAATAPIIGAKDEEVSQAVSTIFLFNIIAIFIFPALGRTIGLDDNGFGMWAGTAINDTSSVVAAGAAWSNLVGDNAALVFATIVKLTRTLMIVPISLILAIFNLYRSKKESGGRFSFVKVFPWFVIFFVAAALINTFTGFPAELSAGLTDTGKFLIVMAMAAIGLNTNIKKLVTNGSRSILLGFSCAVVVAVVSLAAQRALGII